MGNDNFYLLTTDGKNWGWGVETPFIQLDIKLGDGSWLGFGDPPGEGPMSNTSGLIEVGIP